jgi:hypothetical protein
MTAHSIRFEDTSSTALNPTLAAKAFTNHKLTWLQDLAGDKSITDFWFRVLFVVMCGHHNVRRGAFMSYEKLAAEVAGTEEGVRKALRELVRADHLIRRQRGRSKVYFPNFQNRYGEPAIKPPSRGENGTAGMPITQNRDGHTKQPGQPSPHNPSTNPINNPSSSENESAGERASAPDNGALARPPDGKQVATQTAVQEQHRGAAPCMQHKKSNSNAERQRCENEIADVIGWSRLIELSEGRVNELCRQWIEGKKTPDSAMPAVGVTVAAGASFMRGARGVFAFHPANGGYRRPVEAARLKGLGVRAGVPDIIALHRGQVYAIELKTEHGRATAEQLQAIEDIRAAGGHAQICQGLDRALAVLERWGLLRGRAGGLTADMEK